MNKFLSLIIVCSLFAACTGSATSDADSNQQKIVTQKKVNLKTKQIGYYKSPNKDRVFSKFIDLMFDFEEVRTFTPELEAALKKDFEKEAYTEGKMKKTYYYLLENQAPEAGIATDIQKAWIRCNNANPAFTVTQNPAGLITVKHFPENILKADSIVAVLKERVGDKLLK